MTTGQSDAALDRSVVGRGAVGGGAGVTSGLTVLGNVAVDRVDGANPTPGGCPSFIGPTLAAVPGETRVVTRMASNDAPLFASLFANYPVSVTLLPAIRTNGFQLIYDGEDRSVAVGSVGDSWTADDIDAAGIDTEWVHIAPLLREEFPTPALRHLVNAGHRISFDGQGLVREAALGVVRADDRYDPEILSTLSILKLAEEEAVIVAGGSLTEQQVLRLGVPEVVATLGSAGCDIFTSKGRCHVPAARPVLGVHTTGAGEVFAVGYAAYRASGIDPEEAARRASAEVAAMLELRI